ncbi:MAG: PhzF family phenazine biosynthesis isomerase [Phycisphaera sp.]|nr:PhzF family phenazine biosynthesis isomerase [Phycisphaera sp.]
MLPLYQVDAFTDTPFRGNPAAVVVCESPSDTLAVGDGWSQRVAAEMNLSETAFVRRSDDGWGITWFTPTTEVDLCGHATLAAAHVLWETGRVGAATPIVFNSRSGELSATRGDDGWITLDFPLDTPYAIGAPDGIEAALGVRPTASARGREDVLFELPDARAVRKLRPNLALLARIECRGVIVTARSDDKAHDFVSRFFAPQCGIDEDPVTGSAHRTLGAYWRARLGRDALVGYQASARGGVVRVRVDAARDRALLSGQAVTVVRGELMD